MNATFLSRQPIFDRDTRVAYYELSGSIRHDGTQNAQLISALSEMEMTDLPHGRPAIVHLHMQPATSHLPPWPFVGPVPVGVSYPAQSGGTDDQFIHTIPYAAEAAFVCLDDAGDHDLPMQPGRISMVRLDARALGPDEVQERVRRLTNQPIDITIKNISTNDEFELYRAVGAHYFQGPFL